ncbi:Serine/threonine protein kinase, partial [Phytophthora megakarya]
TMKGDCFAFGMCTVQAVTCKFPWGKKCVDLVVSYKVRRGELPQKPKAFTPLQWKFVTHAHSIHVNDSPASQLLLKLLR